MATANDGISRFASASANQLYSGITTPTVVSTGALSLSSPTGIYFAGSLTDQDVPLSVATTVFTESLPFMCNIYCGGGVTAVTLPPLYPGARILFTNNNSLSSVVVSTTSVGAPPVAQQILVPGAAAATTLTVAYTETYLFCNNDGSWLALKFV